MFLPINKLINFRFARIRAGEVAIKVKVIIVTGELLIDCSFEAVQSSNLVYVLETFLNE